MASSPGRPGRSIILFLSLGLCLSVGCNISQWIIAKRLDNSLNLEHQNSLSLNRDFENASVQKSFLVVRERTLQQSIASAEASNKEQARLIEQLKATNARLQPYYDRAQKETKKQELHAQEQARMMAELRAQRAALEQSNLERASQEAKADNAVTEHARKEAKLQAEDFFRNRWKTGDTNSSVKNVNVHLASIESKVGWPGEWSVNGHARVESYGGTEGEAEVKDVGFSGSLVDKDGTFQLDISPN